MFELHGVVWFTSAAALYCFQPDLSSLLSFSTRARISWERAIASVRNLREKLESGWLPEPVEWRTLEDLPAPWGELAAENIADLRSSGVPVVPSLRRIEKALEDQKRSDEQARARSAQAWGQAGVCGAIVPLLSVALYALVPGLSDVGMSWWVCTVFSLALDAGAILWLVRMSENARWAGLEPHRREWWGAALCFDERLLGALRGGTPADLAWARAMPRLQRLASGLAVEWGPGLWSDAMGTAGESGIGRTALILIRHGQALRRAIQASIHEGRGCSERIEAELEALKSQLASEVERELGLLSTRALQPLFLLVAPSVLLLVVMAFALSWESWGFV